MRDRDTRLPTRMDALRLWGTPETSAPSRVLSAGDLTCEWSEGGVRNLRWRGA